MKEVKLTQGKVALVDDADFDYLNQFRWYANRNINSNVFYAKRMLILPNGKRTNLRMHREIMNTPKDNDIDHIDGNGLNNTRKNLRLCSPSQNGANRRIGKNNTSGYKGVYKKKDDKKWTAKIGSRKESKHLGQFKTKEEAARVYDQEALKKYGQFAKLNFPNE